MYDVRGSGTGYGPVNRCVVRNHTGAESYDRKLRDLFSVQDEVTQQIVGRLRRGVRQGATGTNEANSPKDFKAYDLVLQARKHLYNHSESNHRESRDLLERAIALDDRVGSGIYRACVGVSRRVPFWLELRPAPLDRALRAACGASTSIPTTDLHIGDWRKFYFSGRNWPGSTPRCDER